MKTTKYIIIIAALIVLSCAVFALGMIYHRVSIRLPYYALYNTQFVGHGNPQIDSLAENSLALYDYYIRKNYNVIECDVLFTSDNVPILSHCDSLYLNENINHTAVNINTVSYKQILVLANDSSKCKNILIGGGEITTLESLVRFAKSRNVIIQLDMQKHTYSYSQCQIVYHILSEYGMLNKAILEVSDANFWTFIRLDRNLVFQLDEKWDYRSIDHYKKYQFLTSQIILSKWFPNFETIDFKDVIKYGHSKGFLMKCSIINNANVADTLFKQGVDMIVTDSLENSIIKELE